MVFKSIGYGRNEDYVRIANNLNDNPVTEKRQDGNLIALVGNIKNKKVSDRRKNEYIERIPLIDNELLGYNLDGKMCLIRAKKNDRNFDMYLSLPFTKGVTERHTGRTLLILGSNSHHGEAMLGQFSGVIWQPNLLDDVKKYGDTIRWINVGNLREGFIGLDFNSQALLAEGVARSLEDVKFLAQNLLEFGYDSSKRLFLLKPPYIVESDYGKALRKKGYGTLLDYTR
jgi:hypothetical protein